MSISCAPARSTSSASKRFADVREAPRGSLSAFRPLRRCCEDSTGRTRSSITCAGRTRSGSHTPRTAGPRPMPRPSARSRSATTGPASSRAQGGPQIDARVPLLFNADVIAGVAFPTAPDPVYIADGDADQLDLHPSAAAARCARSLGDVAFAQGDYVFVPRGLLHRFIPTGAAALVLVLADRRRCTCRSSGATRSASSAWTRRTRSATSSARSAPRRSTRASASSSCAAPARGTASR